MDDDQAMAKTNPPAARPLRRVVLGLTGGIAAYKAAELTRLHHAAFEATLLERLAQLVLVPVVNGSFWGDFAAS